MQAALLILLHVLTHLSEDKKNKAAVNGSIPWILYSICTHVIYTKAYCIV